jgi:hypothetical protein
MKSTPKIVFLCAVILYVGSFVTAYIESLPKQIGDGPDVFTISDGTWSIWRYASLLLLMCAAGFTIAAFKLRR